MYKLNIESMKEIAKTRRGICLSDVYAGACTKLAWRCLEKHTWYATPDSIRRGSWCPICSSGINERFCRIAFESLTEKIFPGCCLEWLRSTSGRKLKLDGYNEELKLAFEYQGKQHYEKNKYFHKHPGSYEKCCSRDKEKRRLCQNNNVVLIEVPFTVKLHEMRDFIIEKLTLSGFGNKINFNSQIDFSSAYIAKERGLFDEIKKICTNRGGECLEDYYISSVTKMKFKCSYGHIWLATPGRIKLGTWCPKCNGTNVLTLEEMQELANQHGGKCLSTKYINNNTKLKWLCSKGHTWFAIPSNIKQGHWCLECRGKKRCTLEEMQVVANNRGGRCLSTAYYSAFIPLEWECNKKYIFKSNPHNIKRGSWCPICYTIQRGRRILTI